jgi:hypothetical protein
MKGLQRRIILLICPASLGLIQDSVRSTTLYQRGGRVRDRAVANKWGEVPCTPSCERSCEDCAFAGLSRPRRIEAAFPFSRTPRSQPSVKEVGKRCVQGASASARSIDGTLREDTRHGHLGRRHRRDRCGADTHHGLADTAPRRRSWHCKKRHLHNTRTDLADYSSISTKRRQTFP